MPRGPNEKTPEQIRQMYGGYASDKFQKLPNGATIKGGYVYKEPGDPEYQSRRSLTTGEKEVYDPIYGMYLPA